MNIAELLKSDASIDCKLDGLYDWVDDRLWGSEFSLLNGLLAGFTEQQRDRVLSSDELDIAFGWIISTYPGRSHLPAWQDYVSMLKTKADPSLFIGL